MKRFLRNCLLILLLLVTRAGGYIVWQGYEKAQEITAEVSLEQAAQRAMAAADYTPP